MLLAISHVPAWRPWAQLYAFGVAIRDPAEQATHRGFSDFVLRTNIRERIEHAPLLFGHLADAQPLALDIIGGAYRDEFDVAVIFSQDQDLAEVADEIRTISRAQRRWIKVASAFPVSPRSRSKRGIDKTDWIAIDRTTYDLCLDRRNYRGTQQN